MSCSVIAVPWALMWVIGAITAAPVVGAVGPAVKADIDLNKELKSLSESDKNINVNSEKHLSDRYAFSMENVVEREFETPFIDKEILIKTLEEHGVVNIKEYDNGEISGTVDTFSLKFSKLAEGSPYKLKISCRENDSAEEKVKDVSSEYALNVQEAAYLSIIKKLKDNNMQIEEETVEDDNTIVLTINLE